MKKLSAMNVVKPNTNFKNEFAPPCRIYRKVYNGFGAALGLLETTDAHALLRTRRNVLVTTLARDDDAYERLVDVFPTL